MIGVSTRQNTTNLVPFLQFNFKELRLLETCHSQTSNWGKNLSKVLSAKHKIVKSHDIGKGDDLKEMIEIINNSVKGSSVVCWNIGGGQKMQQAALFYVFRQRVAAGCSDWACYADAGARKLYVITDENDLLQSRAEPITTSMELQDILSIFGLRIKNEQEKRPLWRKNHNNSCITEDLDSSAFDMFSETCARQELFEWYMRILALENIGNVNEFYKIPRNLYNFIKKTGELDKEVSSYIKGGNGKAPAKLPKVLMEEIFPEILKQELAKCEADIPKPLQENYPESAQQKSTKRLETIKKLFPDYFERVVQQKISNLLAQAQVEHHICEAWANIRVEEMKTGKEIGEWDIVLVTSFGTLIILDAKTGIFPQKDEDARLYNLEKASGFYGDFQVVFPYFWDDMREEGFFASQEETRWNEQRKTPINLQERGSNFMAVMDRDECYVWLENKKHITLGETEPDKEKKAVKIVNLDNLLCKLRLLQN